MRKSILIFTISLLTLLLTASQCGCMYGENLEEILKTETTYGLMVHNFSHEPVYATLSVGDSLSLREVANEIESGNYTEIMPNRNGYVKRVTVTYADSIYGYVVRESTLSRFKEGDSAVENFDAVLKVRMIDVYHRIASGVIEFRDE